MSSGLIEPYQHKGEFFKVLETTANCQVAVMTIEPGGDSGEGDMHPGDQVVCVIEGGAEVNIKDEVYDVGPGEVIVVPPETEHRIYNKGSEDLFFLNVYTPPAY